MKKPFRRNSFISLENFNDFLSLIQEINNTMFNGRAFDKNIFISGVAQYPQWKKYSPLFHYFSEDFINDLKNKKKYFIFNTSFEGYDPDTRGWFDMIHYQCEKKEIDPSQIIFISSNMFDEENFKNYNLQKNKKPFHVLSFPMFESLMNTEIDAVDQLKISIDNTNSSFQDKYFSSLSRTNRNYRTIMQFLIYHSEFSNRALLSHNSLDKKNIKDIQIISPSFFEKFPRYNLDHFHIWNENLPLTIDQTDFNVNWACGTKFEKIHDATLFHLVNETLVDHKNSMFYSEKTFRPIKCFQPFIILGQPGCNHYLKDLGYKLYDDWFDLEFDFEKDPIIRCEKILKVLEQTCKLLDSFTIEEKIKWKFKNQEVLIHNYNVMKNRNYTKEKFKNWIEQNFINYQ